MKDEFFRPIFFSGRIGQRDNKPIIIIDGKFTPSEIGAIHAAMFNHLKSIDYQGRFSQDE